MDSQTPPPTPSPAFHVAPLPFGAPWQDPDGVEHLAARDLVMLKLLDPAGDVLVTVTQNPEGAIRLARALQATAVEVISQAVDDRGRPTGIVERFARINAAYAEEL